MEFKTPMIPGAEEAIAKINGVIMAYRGVRGEGALSISRETAISKIRDLGYSYADAERWLGPTVKGS